MYQVFAVSDSTGITAQRVLQAALTQFEAEVHIERIGHVRTEEEVQEVVQRAAAAGGFIVHTLVSADLRRTMLTEGRLRGVDTMDLMGPLLGRLTTLLQISPLAKPGLLIGLDDEYFRRIEAVEFAVRHDDGRNIRELDRAEIVLLGVSRTAKTPTSMYLAYRGWMVGNVPIILGVEPPPSIFELPRRRVVCLTVQPERLGELRQARAERIGVGHREYADLDYICRELAYAYQVFDRRRDWPIVDVTSKPIEETAAEVIALVGEHRPAAR